MEQETAVLDTDDVIPTSNTDETISDYSFFEPELIIDRARFATHTGHQSRVGSNLSSHNFD